MLTKIISAFPGTGKSHYQKCHHQTSLDSDSSSFSWSVIDGKKVRNPDFPANYINHIKDNLGHYKYIFVSSHAEVRKALREAGLKFYLIYPKMKDKAEYLRRYKDRGSPQAFLDLLDNNWEAWITECRNEKEGCVNIKMFWNYISEEINDIQKNEEFSKTKDGYGF